MSGGSSFGVRAYLDHAATSPLRPEARAAMEPFGDAVYANPSGAHRFAREARRAVDEARDEIAALVGCAPGEVVFTSGGTEADNAAVLGAVRRHGGTALCPAAEHHAVLHCVEHTSGVVTAVDSLGRTDPDRLAAVLADIDDPAVVSVMAVNNETGVVNDLASVSAAVRRSAPGAVLHTDAVQAACWLDLRALWPHVDAMSLSSHKFGGPKGAGVLVVRDGVRLEPLLMGGGQERDRRSGTHNVAGIVGTAAALREIDRHRTTECERIARLRDRLVVGITDRVEGASATLPAGAAVPGIAHLCIEGIENEALLFLLDRDGICASAASACASGAMEPSHVLAAMGVPMERARGSLRLSFGHTTTVTEVDAAVEAVTAAATRLREPSR